MPTDLDQLIQIGAKVQEFGEAVVALQKANDVSAEQSKKLGEKCSDFDAFKNSTTEKAAEAAALALETANDIKLKMTAIEKTQEYIEKAVSRIGTSKGGEDDEMEAKAGEETARYLRDGTPMSDETVKNVCTAMCAKSFFGADDERKAFELKTLIAGVNPQGGYFIRPQRSATMIQRIFETSPMRGSANIETTSNDTLEFLIDDNEAGTGGWVGEVQDRDANTGTPDIGLLTIPIHEQYAQPYATQKMLDDAGFNIEGWLSGKVTRRMSREENTTFLTGSGSQRPRGLLTYNAWAANGTYERGAIEQINSGIADNFSADGIKALQNAVKEEYQGGSKFFTKRINFLNITTLKDTQEQYLLDPRSLKMGDTKVLLGKDVIFMNDIPEVGADTLSLVYGDLGVGYTIVDRIGFRVIRDIYTAKPFIKFYTTKRVGGDVTNYEAFKIQVCAV